jgi:uncharacterized membrane protein
MPEDTPQPQTSPSQKPTNWKAIIIIIVVGLVLVGLGVLLFFALQPKETTSSKEETNVPSSSETATEPASPKTEVKVQGQNATLVISPSVDNEISGIVTVTVTEVPSETKWVFFTIAARDERPNSPNLGIDEDGSDGWSRTVDTTKYKNGVYVIAGMPTTTAEGDPLGRASAKVRIKN